MSSIPPNMPPVPAPTPEPPRPDAVPPPVEEPPQPGGPPPVQEPPVGHPPASVSMLAGWALLC